MEEDIGSLLESRKHWRGILEGLSKGLLQKEIAWQEGLSYGTVKEYVFKINRAFGTRNSYQLVAIYVEWKTFRRVRDDSDCKRVRG